MRVALFTHGLEELTSDVGKTGDSGDLIKFVVHLIAIGLEIMCIPVEEVLRDFRGAGIGVLIENNLLVFRASRGENPEIGVYFLAFQHAIAGFIGVDDGLFEQCLMHQFVEIA